MSSTNNTTAFQTNSRANAPDMTPDHFAPLFSDNSKRASLQGGMAIEIAAACFLALLLGWSSLSYPLGADQGILAVWAQELARGAVPYRDIWEQRPPLFYFLICFGYLAGLREHLLVRLVDLILQIATAGVLSALGRRWFGRGAGVLTGFLYAFSYFGMVSYQHQAQPESLYGLLLGIAFLLLDPWIQKAEDTPAWNFANKTRCFGAGVCCGLAFLSKYPIVFCLPVFFYVLFIKHALRACLWRWGLWTMGALTPIILLCAWFWAIGALRNFVIDTIVFNFFHASRGVEGSAIADGVLRYYSPGILELFQGFVFLLLDKKEIIAPLLLLLIVKLPRRALIVSGLYLLCAGGGIVLQRKIFLYHFIAIMPPLAMLSAAALRGLVVKIRDQAHSRSRRMVWSVICLLSLGAGYQTAARWLRSVQSAIKLCQGDELWRAQYIDSHFQEPIKTTSSFVLSDNLEAARVLRTLKSSGDQLLLIGRHALLQYLADIQPSTRFIMSVPFHADGHPKTYEDEIDAALAKHPPQFIAVYGIHNPALADYFQRYVQPLYERPSVQGVLAGMEPIAQYSSLTLYATRDRAQKWRELNINN